MLRKRLLGFTVTNDFGAYASCRAAPNVFSSVAKIPVGIKSVPTNASPMKCVLVQWRGLSGNRKVMSDLAIKEPAAFGALVEKAKAALA